MITGDMTVGRLLDEHPDLVEVLVRYHPHFTCLRKSLLRRVMGPRVTLAFAARIAGVPADDLVATLRRAAGEPERDAAPHPTLSPEGRGFVQSPKPEALAAVAAPCQLHLDVREDVRRGQEPFARIMAAVKALEPGQVFVLRAPFEPAPLYEVLGKRGFAHWTERRAADDWSIWFYREAGAAPPARPQAAPAQAPISAARTRVLDVRGLEPPEPMVKILEALEELIPGEVLEVLHERRPMLLYPQLDDRGFVHETDEPEPGLSRISIRHGGRAR
jgi:uncharacterized protein (DUF2249 family)